MRLAVPLALVLLLVPSPAPAGDRDPETSPAARRVTPEQQQAIARGLAFLATRQSPNGAFATSDGAGDGPAKSADYQTAVTAIGLLAFLGAGEGLSHGKYRSTVTGAVNFLLSVQSAEGYICGSDTQSKMHGHGFATLALAEAYGTAASARDAGAHDPSRQVLSERLRSGVQKAVDCIHRSQAEAGGWDYIPASGGKSDHEGSVTVCQVQALQAASNRGFVVKLDAIKKAREYMRRSQVEGGGFKYRLSQEEKHSDRTYTYALAAAGVTSLVGLGDYGRQEAVEKGMKFLERKNRRPAPGNTDYYYYGTFYAVQAYHWIGGDRWDNWWPGVRSEIMKGQSELDGSWSGKDTHVALGRVYPTAFSLLMLEVPVEYLSIFAK